MKILPVTYPPITSYPVISNLLAITSSHPETEAWMVSNYMQLCYRKDPPEPVGTFLDSRHDDLFCPHVQMQIFDKKFVELKWNHFSEFCCEMIDHDYYPRVYVDQFEIQHYGNYQENHVEHPIFIFGYEEQAFHVADFFKFGKYSFKTIPFEHLNRAFESSLSFQTQRYFSTYEYCAFQYEFSIARIKQGLSDYLNSEDSTGRFHFASIYYPFMRNISYGLSYYDCMIEALKSGDYDKRSSFVLCDHKKMMLLRLAYLKSHGYLKNDAVIAEYQTIYEKTIKNLNLLLKSIIKGSEISDSLICDYWELKKMDRTATEHLLNSLT